ncbi:MAG: alpha/beta fold hydrolase [Leptospiraceae bacterium]
MSIDQKKKRFLVLLIPVILLTVMAWYSGGCSSLYYFPDNRSYYDPEEFSFEYESDFLKVQDDERIHFWYFPSQTKQTKAVVLHFHGNAQNISSHFLLSAWLVRYGFDVMIFDYRGYGKSDGTPSPENTYQDALVALSEASGRAYEKGVPLIILGQSLGGAVALRAIVDSDARNEVALFVADSTFPSYRRIVERKASEILFAPLAPFVSFFFSNRRSPEETINEISPIPVLVMHSSMDPVVGYENGKDLYQSLGPPRRFYRIPDAGHLSWSRDGQSVTDQMLIDTMNRALQAHRNGTSPFDITE